MMKYLTRHAALLGLGLALSLGAGSALAQQQRPAAAPAKPALQPVPVLPLPPKGTLIITVNPPLIEQHSTAYQAIRAAHEKQIAALQAEAQKREAEMRTTDEELNKQRTILSPDAYAQKRRDLEKKFNDSRQWYQNNGREIEQTAGEAYNKVTNAWLEIVRDITSANEYKLVMSRTQLVISHDSLDITGEVIQQLNKKLPSVAVKMPPLK